MESQNPPELLPDEDGPRHEGAQGMEKEETNFEEEVPETTFDTSRRAHEENNNRLTCAESDIVPAATEEQAQESVSPREKEHKTPREGEREPTYPTDDDEEWVEQELIEIDLKNTPSPGNEPVIISVPTALRSATQQEGKPNQSGQIGEFTNPQTC